MLTVPHQQNRGGEVVWIFDCARITAEYLNVVRQFFGYHFRALFNRKNLFYAFRRAFGKTQIARADVEHNVLWIQERERVTIRWFVVRRERGFPLCIGARNVIHRNKNAVGALPCARIVYVNQKPYNTVNTPTTMHACVTNFSIRGLGPKSNKIARIPNMA